MSLELCPLTLKEAHVFVERFHRHHKPSVGGKFAIGVTNSEGIVGVVVVGRPVARHLDDGWTFEVTRLCVNGHKNASSMLYAAAWRASRAMGARWLITYTLQKEGGASLRGASWKLIGERGGGSWSCPSRPRVDTHPLEQKHLWERSGEEKIYRKQLEKGK